MTRWFALVAALLALAPLRPASAADPAWTPEAALELAALAARTSLTSVPAAPVRDLEDGLRALGAPADAFAGLEAKQRAGLARIVSAAVDAALIRGRVFAPYAAVLDDVLADPARAPVLLAGLDRGALLAAELTMVRSVRAAMPTLATIRLDAPVCAERIVCIGSDGDDTWSEDVQVLIDPAGDDTYLNNAGGTLTSVIAAATGGCVLGGGSTGASRPNLACSPAPSNVCSYDTLNRASGRDDLPVVGVPGHADPDEPGDGADGSCGSDARRDRTLAALAAAPSDADARAITVLVDLDGADTYTQPWQHEDPLFNLLEDCYPGQAEIVNTNRDFIQGASLAGLALTWDTGTGGDVFRGRLNAQGSGHVGGVGMLVVEGEGDTTFWADRLSQGNGIAAGIGLLVDTASGAQRFLLEPPVVYRNEFSPNARDCQQEGRAGQAQGGFGGVGIVVTAGGASSHYRAVTHVTSNAYPYEPVLDAAGAPRLVPGTDTQGSGESFPITATSGGLVVGGGLLVDATDGDARGCVGHARAGMLRGASTSSGIALDSIGVIDPACGKFNVTAELGADLGEALQRIAGGAVGVRVVLP